MVVGKKVNLEVKLVDRLTRIDESPLLTHLRLPLLRVGLLMNFNVERLKDGIVRRII